MKFNSSLNSFWSLSTAIVIFGVLALTLWGNSNNLNPRYLFIDEQITFYPIAKILNPSGLDEWLWLVADGSDYRYGRILWNAIALFAFIPAKLFGETGQIIASREAGTAFLLMSYLLLTHTFIQKLSIRFFALITLISLPYNSYYMSMPKPEPIMLLCAALFLYFYKKNNLILGKPYWIFLGLAFGAKISFLLPLIALLGAAILIQFNVKKMGTIGTEICSTIVYLGLGFALANPFFIPAFMAIAYLLIYLFFISKLIGITPLKASGIAILILIPLLAFGPTREYALGDLLDVSGSRHAFGEWTRATFLRVNDGDGPLNQNIATWFFYLCEILIPRNLMLGEIYIFSMGVFLLGLSENLITEIISQKSSKKVNLLLFSVGVLLLASPMIGVKNRLWGMYLFPGMVFVILAFFSQIASMDLSEEKQSMHHIRKIFSLLLLTATGILAVYSWIPRFISDFLLLTTRNSLDVSTHLPPWLIGI